MERSGAKLPLHTRPANGRLRALAATGLVLLGVAEVASVVAETVFVSVSAVALQARDIMQTQDDLLIALEGAERGQRGYLLTGETGYLRPYARSVAEIPALTRHLEKLVRDDRQQTAALTTLRALIADKMGELAQTIVLEGRGRHEAAVALVRADDGRRDVSRLRELIEHSRGIVRARLDRRRAFVFGVRRGLRVVSTLGLAVAALMAYVIARAWRDYEDRLRERNEALAAEMVEREQAEARLRQAQKMEALGQLTGGVAHDFNNMLAVIVGSLDVLMRRLGPDQKRLTKLAEIALSGANRAAALTRRLLAFSRLQPLDPRAADVNRCVAELVEVFRRTLGANIAIVTVLEDGLWPALIDLPQLESALLNLAVNARDAMAAGGTLTMKTGNVELDADHAEEGEDEQPGEYVMIAMTDTGSGMTEAVAMRAFDPFFTTKDVGQGTGLGLSQVIGFIKQSGGLVKLHSQVGVGTTVTLYLPRAAAGVVAGVVAAPAAALEVAARPAAAALLVLVVEDEPGVREMAVSALGELGYDVRAVDGGAAALALLEEEPRIAVMLTDVMMPGMNGRQLVEAALRRRPDLRVIYMTGYTRDVKVHDGVLHPGIRLLTKPFTIAQLGDEMQRIAMEPAAGQTLSVRPGRG